VDGPFVGVSADEKGHRPPYPCPFFRLRLSSITGAQIGAGIHALANAVAELARARGEARPGVRATH